MMDYELGYALAKVGMSTFVEHFELLRSHANGEISLDQCKESLRRRGNVIPTYASRIFKGRREYDALRIVCESKVRTRVRERAGALLESEGAGFGY